MSLALIDGFFALANGRRVAPVPKPGTIPENPSRPQRLLFISYDTAIQCTNGQQLPATVRVYSHPSNNPLPDNVVVCLKGKMFIPTPPSDSSHLTSPILLDGMVCDAFPGDPAEESYEDHIPSLMNPYVYIIGTVSSSVEIDADGRRLFSISYGEYVRDSLQFSTVTCILDSKSPRWKNTPSPAQSSCVGIFGICESFDRTLHINVMHMALNCRPQDPYVAAPDGSSPTPAKKRHFQATVTPLSSSPPNPQAGPSNTPSEPVSPSPSTNTSAKSPPKSRAPGRTASKPAGRSTRSTAPAKATQPLDAPPLDDDDDMYNSSGADGQGDQAPPPADPKGKGKATG